MSINQRPFSGSFIITLRKRPYQLLVFLICLFFLIAFGLNWHSIDGVLCENNRCMNEINPTESNLLLAQNQSIMTNTTTPTTAFGEFTTPAISEPKLNQVNSVLNSSLQDIPNSEEIISTITATTTKPPEPFVKTNINQELKIDFPFTIVTAASDNHFCVLQSWLYATKETFENLDPSLIPRVIIYDLGLADYQRQILSPLHSLGFYNELRRFNFTAYPSFWNINKLRGQYAWKTGIVHEVTRDHPGIVAWLDAGSIFHQNFITDLLTTMEYNNGFLSPRSNGRIPDWTHRGTFKYLHMNSFQFRKYPNCNGAMIIFDSLKSHHLINEWYQCALAKECIAPKGSSRKNHRQDQAILSLLAAMDERRCTETPEYYGVDTHQDHFCQDRIINYEKSHPEVRWQPNPEQINMVKKYREKNPMVSEIYDVWTTPY